MYTLIFQGENDDILYQRKFGRYYAGQHRDRCVWHWLAGVCADTGVRPAAVDRPAG